jgi:hypothetical protein
MSHMHVSSSSYGMHVSSSSCDMHVSSSSYDHIRMSHILFCCNLRDRNKEHSRLNVANTIL